MGRSPKGNGVTRQVKVGRAKPFKMSRSPNGVAWIVKDGRTKKEYHSKRHVR